METIGIDETSRRGHQYITVVVDLTERNVICVVPGKDSTTMKRFADDFMAHNGDPNRVRLVTCDMSLGFAKGIRDHLPTAAKIIDKFHGVVPFCWTSLSLLFDYATSPSSRRRSMMLMPNSVLILLSRYQTM